MLHRLQQIFEQKFHSLHGSKSASRACERWLIFHAPVTGTSQARNAPPTKSADSVLMMNPRRGKIPAGAVITYL